MMDFNTALRIDAGLRGEFYKLMNEMEEKSISAINATLEENDKVIVSNIVDFAKSKGYELNINDEAQEKAIREACRKVQEEISSVVKAAFSIAQTVGK